MNSLTKPSYACVAFLLLFIACKKDKAVEITQESIAGNYKLQKVTFKPDSGGNEQDITDAMTTPCVMDDVYMLEADGDYMYHDLGAPCGGDVIGTWNLNSTTSISINGTALELFSFDGNTLVTAHPYDHLGVDGKLKNHLRRQ